MKTNKIIGKYLTAIISIVLVTMATGTGVDNLCFAQGWGGGGGGGQQQQPTINPPQSVKFNGPETIGKTPVPFILVFDNEESKEIKKIESKVKLLEADMAKVYFIQVILTPEDVELLFPKKSAKNAPAEEEAESPKSKGFELAKKYEIKSIPFAVICDTYGNCIQTVQTTEVSTGGNAIKVTKVVTDKQKELETSIPKSYEKIAKTVKAEIEKKNITNQTIKELLKIAKYQGYKNTEEARANLAEMNDIAAAEMAALTEGNKVDEDPQIVSNLEKFAYKYKGLPAADSASKLAQEIKKKPKPKPGEKKEEPKEEPKDDTENKEEAPE